MRRIGLITIALGTVLLLPSTAMAAAGTIDQSQESLGLAAIGFGDPQTPPIYAAQVFTAGRSGALTAVAFVPSGNGYAKRDVHVEIRNAAGGQPGATVLASGDIKTSLHDKFVKISFRSAPTVTEGTQYALVLVGTGDLGFVVSGALGNPYAAGAAWTSFDATTWYEQTSEGFVDFDFAFRTYVA